MKFYLLILFTLIVIGLGLAYKVFNEEEKLDETVFLTTTDSIRNLQTLDKNLLILLQQSRFNAQFDSESLSETHYQLSEEFDNLRYDALFEEIEASESLSNAVDNFDEKFFMRDEVLEEYISSNVLVSESLNTIRSSLETITLPETPQDNSLTKQLIEQTNSDIYQVALGLSVDTPDESDLNTRIQQIQTAYGDINETLINNYTDAITTFWSNYQTSLDAYNVLTELETGPLLDDIENEYTEHHNKAIESSTQLRNALIIYGVALLCALLFFGYLIRKNFLSLEQQVADRTQEIEAAYKDLKESQEQLIQSEKMASLGEMVAGVAHEINTPLGYVTSNIDTIKLNIADMNEIVDGVDDIYQTATANKQDKKAITSKLVSVLNAHKKIGTREVMLESDQLLSDGSYGLSEISKLVTSLKDFARLDRQSTEEIDIHQCIDNSLTIASNSIKENNVEVIKSYGELPTITCIPSKLNQLFLNIINNACQAMTDNSGQLKVSSEQVNDNIVIKFKDNGAGMSEEIMSKIFDPFFTTKEIGKGTGLGLSIAYKIVKSHGGKIDVKSENGQGTEMIISLPINNNASLQVAS